MKNLLICLFLLSFSACGHKKRPTIISQEKKVEVVESQRSLQESIARIVDIADTPMHTVVKNIYYAEYNNNHVQIVYQYDGWTRQDVKDFYIQEMERLGWYLEHEFMGYQDLLCFCKPDRSYCVVSLQDKKFIVTLIKS